MRVLSKARARGYAAIFVEDPKRPKLVVPAALIRGKGGSAEDLEYWDAYWTPRLRGLSKIQSGIIFLELAR